MNGGLVPAVESLPTEHEPQDSMETEVEELDDEDAGDSTNFVCTR